MVQQFSHRKRTMRSMVPGLTLDGVWFAGVTLGLLAARFYGGSVEALALPAGSSELTVWGACVVTVLPLFLSALAVSVFHRPAVYCSAGLRGLLLGFSLGSLTAAGGPWLGLLLLFSGLCGSGVLYWFLRRRLIFGPRLFRRDLVYCTLAAVLAAAVDTWAIAPFLAYALLY